MSTLLEHNRARLERLEHLGRLAGPVARILEDGKREQLLDGRDADGGRFAPLAKATLERPRLCPTPLAPHGPMSRVVLGYRVEVEDRGSTLIVSAGWPGLGWIPYHVTGTRRMPRRDPSGFRAEDLRLLRELLQRYSATGAAS